MPKSKKSQDAVVIPSPDCEGGYTIEAVENILGARSEEFWHWMRGQTMMLCEGRRWSHEDKQYHEACGGVAHGPVTYSWDLKRFMGIVPGKEIWD